MINARFNFNTTQRNNSQKENNTFAKNRTNKQNINFKSDIRFIGWSQFLDKKSLMTGVKNFYEAGNPAKKLRIVDGTAKTDCIIYCISGIINNLTKRYSDCFHAFPPDFLKPSNLRELAPLKKEIQESNISGLLIGGSTSPQIAYESPFVKWSALTAKELFDTLGAKKRQVSMFLFQKQSVEKNIPAIDFMYDRTNDTYWVTRRQFSYEADDNYPLSTAPWSVEEIRNYFSLISVAKKDKVFIGNEEVPKKALTKGVDLLEKPINFEEIQQDPAPREYVDDEMIKFFRKAHSLFGRTRNEA